MSDSTLDHDDRTPLVPGDHDDLTPFQEYFIAGLVVLLFGLLYWFLNHGWNTDTDLVATPSIPKVELDGTSGVNGKAALTTAAVAAPAAVAQTAKAEPGTEEATENMDAKAAEPDFKVVADQAKPDAESTIETPLSEADVAHLKSAEEAIKKAEIELAETEKAIQEPVAEAEKTPEAQKTPEAEKPGEASDPAPAATPQTAESEEKKPAADGLVYTLPDGSEIKIAADGFENDLKTAILNKELNKPIIFDNIYFESGSSQIDAKSDHQIRATAALLHNHPEVKVLLRGHTDNTGIPSNNTQLSLMRANAMGLALGRLGIDTQRLRILGVGSIEPIDTNETEEGRSKNRRIEVLIFE